MFHDSSQLPVQGKHFLDNSEAFTSEFLDFFNISDDCDNVHAVICP